MHNEKSNPEEQISENPNKDLKKVSGKHTGISRSSIAEISIKSSSERELRIKILRKFNKKGKKISVKVSVVKTESRSAEAIFLHRKLGGLFLANGSLARVSISRIGLPSLEF